LSYYCYLLVSDGGAMSYVGWTTDLDKRLDQHNAGTGARSTRGRSWALAYAERHPSRASAMSREWHLKRDRALRKAIRDAVG
jgi:putative endonuclease